MNEDEEDAEKFRELEANEQVVALLKRCLDSGNNRAQLRQAHQLPDPKESEEPHSVRMRNLSLGLTVFRTGTYRYEK